METNEEKVDTSTPVLIKDVFKSPLQYEQLVEVVLVSNDDYEYLIPKELKNEFENLTAQIDDIYAGEQDENSEFVHQLQADYNNKFDQYRKEGTLPKLYAKVGYEKEL